MQFSVYKPISKLLLSTFLMWTISSCQTSNWTELDETDEFGVRSKIAGNTNENGDVLVVSSNLLALQSDEFTFKLKSDAQYYVDIAIQNDTWTNYRFLSEPFRSENVLVVFFDLSRALKSNPVFHQALSNSQRVSFRIKENSKDIFNDPNITIRFETSGIKNVIKNNLKDVFSGEVFDTTIITEDMIENN
jgi:hypothetical protein